MYYQHNTKKKCDTLGRHSKPPPVTLSNANDKTLWGTIAATLQAIIAPVHRHIAQYIKTDEV